jgi:hypothetical protein
MAGKLPREPLPDAFKGMAETIMLPYHLNEQGLGALRTVCEELYNIGITRGYTIGMREGNESQVHADAAFVRSFSSGAKDRGKS